MGFCALGLGFMKKKTKEKWEWDFNLSNTGWDCGIELGFEKNNFLGNGIRTPPSPSRPSYIQLIKLPWPKNRSYMTGTVRVT